MKKFLILIFISFFTQNICFAMTPEKLERLKSKAKNEISYYAIDYYCANEDVGLSIDSEMAEQIYYSSSCKCAIKAGKEDDGLVAEAILDQCGI